MLKETILGFLAVLVHYIPNDREINETCFLRLNYEFVILVVPVSVDESHHGINYLRLLLGAQLVVVHNFST